MQAERNIFMEVFGGLKRQGPGSDAYTKQALDLIPNLREAPKVLDIGCGTGAQTLVLAKEIQGAGIIALDNSKEHLIELENQIPKTNLRSEIKIMEGSMFKLPFPSESFDLIWSEGSIYIIGFQKGLSEWRPFLKPGGSMAVSHLSWITQDVPQEVKSFWEKETEVATIEENIHTITSSGFELINQFVMPRDGWWENYYVPILARLEQLKKEVLTASEQKAADEIQEEIDLYEKYGTYYSYVFYIIRKTS